MVIVFSAILLGLLALSKPLQRNSFYIIHSAIVIFAAYYFENNIFKVDPLNPKVLLLFLVFHFISINFITILAYFFDKKAAQNGGWRVSEKNLHALELLGGWIGALVGQKIFKHKTKKANYQGAFWFLGIMQICAIYIILKFLNVV